MIGSVAMMMETSFGLTAEARSIWSALDQVFADGYASLRYKMGAPIAPEGEGYFSITWPLAVYDKLGVSSETALTKLWPLTTAAAALTELANSLLVDAPTMMALVALAAAAAARKNMTASKVVA